MKNLTLFLLLMTFGSGCLAQERHDHKAHTHGLAEMTVVYESHQLIIELKTPAANILGFEHEPHTKGEKSVLSHTTKLLNDPAGLFEINPGCELIKVEVDLPYEEDLAGNEIHDGEHHHESHQEEHDTDHENNSHKDVTLAYEWRCESSSPPKIQLQVFGLFPGFESVQSQWLVNGKQGLTQLNSDSYDLEFRE